MEWRASDRGAKLHSCAQASALHAVCGPESKYFRKMLSNSVNICCYFFIAKSQSIGQYVRIR